MIDTIELRRRIGWLGLLLPWFVALLLWRIPPSISATYYTYEAGPVFMIILGYASFLLFSYNGYDKQDAIINSFAGLFGLMICLFPCKVPELDLEFTGTFQLPVDVCNIIHYCSAVAFFALLAYNSLFLFTKHGHEEMTRNKKNRNIIYRVCGIGMIIAFTILLLPEFYIQVWLVEAIALFFFGISFLTKANCYPWLFCDKK